MTFLKSFIFFWISCPTVLESFRRIVDVSWRNSYARDLYWQLEQLFSSIERTEDFCKEKIKIYYLNWFWLKYSQCSNLFNTFERLIGLRCLKLPIFYLKWRFKVNGGPFQAGIIKISSSNCKSIFLEIRN